MLSLILFRNIDKNRIKNPFFTGYRNILVNAEVDDHICEVQDHFFGLVVLKKKMLQLLSSILCWVKQVL